MASHYVSPSHTHEKLDSPSYVDLVDVFEDRMRKWLLEPAQYLLTTDHGAVPAISLILGYFEGIEIYRSGKDSNGASKEFFCRGFQRILCSEPKNSHLFDQVANGLYVQARCGFAHDGLFRNRVFFSDARPEALIVTWPKKNGEFDKDGKPESIVINAERFITGVVADFDRYILVLRSEADAILKASFLAAVDLKWALNEPDRLIGMPESEFFGGKV